MATTEITAPTRGTAGTLPEDVKRYSTFIKEGGPGPNAHVVLLGLDLFDTPHLLKAIHKGFRFRTLERFSRNVLLPLNDVLALVDISRRTLTRRKREGRLAPEESDRLVRASRVYGKALELFEGNLEAASKWLVSPQRGLGGAVPVDFARSDVGAREVERLIDRLEHGVFS